MIQPDSIPLFTGDLGQLERHTDALRVEADGIRRASAEAHRQFQGLSAFYEAPEAEQLFASTAPARDGADTFADKVATVADALSTYAAEVAPVIARLERLQSKATAFVAGLKTPDGEFDEDWTDDADKVEQHQALMHDVNVAQAAFTAAEIACNNKITALVGGTQYVMNTGARQFSPIGAEMYGYSAEVLDHAEKLPWGTPETQSHDWWDPDDLGYYAKSFFWDGFIVDNVWGTVDGLATLVGVHGSDDAGQAWEGVVRAIVGAETYLMESGGQKPTGAFASDFAQDSKQYAKEFGKSFVAWDMWKENPARAAATVVFNGLTLGVGPLKAASAGRAGTAAKVATSVAKVGDAIDPISATVKVTGHAVPKIAEVAASLRGVDDVPDLSAPHSVLELSDGSRLVVEDGQFIAYDKHGDLVGEAPKQEHPVPEGTVSAREREFAGAGATGATSRAPHITTHAGDGPSPHDRHETSAGHRDVNDSHGRTEGAHGSTGRAGTGGGGGSRTAGGAEHGNAGSSGHGSAGLHGDKTDWPEHVRRQVEKANQPDKKWLEAHYGSDGRRLREDGVDEYGDRLTKLKPDPDHPGKWLPKIEKQVEPPKYHLGETIARRRADATPENLEALDKAAHSRRTAIDADQAIHPKVEAAEKAYAKDPTLENRDLLRKVLADHAPLHDSMGKRSEEFGEGIAELQAIPDNYEGAQWVDLADTPTHADRFDQVWSLDDGRFVVVEAKSNVNTRLGHRTLATGKKVSQGTLEYFEDILKKMEERGRTNPKEAQVYSALADALDEGKVEYVLVKGKSDGHTYAGYVMKKFDISLPKGATGADTTAAP
ncbi:hypothetical protein [Streptomyces sp. KAU_LT]|uniref:hypothetical protein n=1 Tax=Streptomyces sp. KAU_LT TaxID=3046669 RepID=UPI0024B86CD1|nr:hypothetical protein [Streptomyces sp. KAU_LT]MDI9834454.1 hypothetical protein [Streptomyces sp. KAU_LT]